MADWTDLSSAFGFGAQLTSAQMQQLRDNITAAIEGSSGAPQGFPIPSLPNVSVVNSPVAACWADVMLLVARHRIYLPPNRRSLHGQFYLDRAGATNASGVRFRVESAESSVGVSLSHSGTWVAVNSLDISAYAGSWVNLEIEITNSGGVDFSHLWGYAFMS